MKKIRALRSQRDEMCQGDGELARREQDLLDAEEREKNLQLQRSDFEFARSLQCNVEAHFIQNKEMQEAQDRQLAEKLLTSSARLLQEAEEKKKTLESFNTWSLQSVAAQWENADGDVSDVMGGLRITVLLPHLKDLKVTMKKSLISVRATRNVFSGDKFANARNTYYNAEFEILGNDLRLTKDDLKYTYESESGLLHVYVENIHLNDELNSETDTGLLGSIRNSFTRLFSNNSALSSSAPQCKDIK